MKKKIPDHAQCVFKGVLFDVYQWQQEMFDGSFATFEAIKRNTSVKVIGVTENKKILVTFEEQPGQTPFISLPGGQSYSGEDLKLCAQRELLEETGYTSDDFREWFRHDIFGWQKLDWDIQYFIASNCSKTKLQILDSGEKILVKELAFEEFIEVAQKDEFNVGVIKNRLKEIAHNKEDLEKFKKEIFG